MLGQVALDGLPRFTDGRAEDEGGIDGIAVATYCAEHGVRVVGVELDVRDKLPRQACFHCLPGIAVVFRNPYTAIGCTSGNDICTVMGTCNGAHAPIGQTWFGGVRQVLANGLPNTDWGVFHAVKPLRAGPHFIGV